MADENEKTGVAISVVIALVTSAAVVGAAFTYALLGGRAVVGAPAARPALTGGAAVLPEDLGNVLRTWAEASALRTMHEIGQVYSVYGWTLQIEHLGGDWNRCRVSFSGSLPGGEEERFVSFVSQ
jgi:hypothetical protein